MRVAIYARYSSDKQNPHSSEDQIRVCRKFAASKAWQVLDEHVYSDDAISGSRSDRPSYQRMMAVIREAERTHHCPFDGVLVEDSSRLWRDNAEQASAMKVANSVGIRVLSCDGLDTGSNSGSLLLTFKGVMAEEYLKELANRTRRGLQSAAIEGNHTGGRVFGYQNVPLPTTGHSKRRPSKLVVDEQQAKTVERIFKMYADGYSYKTIAKTLNTEKVPSPQPWHGRQQSWAPSSIRVILHNERYRGFVTFGKTRKHKKSDDRRIAKPGIEAEKIRREFPEQRIVSDALWNRVRDRLASMKEIYGERRPGLSASGNSAGNPYLFSGLLKCAECGGNIVLVSGKGRNHGQPHYGCSRNAQRGTCSNRVKIRKDVLETRLLAHLGTEVLREDVIRHAMSKLEAAAMKHQSNRPLMETFERKRSGIQKELVNLSKVIASGFDSDTVRAQIAERERQVKDIDAQIASSEPAGIKAKLEHAHRHIRDDVKRIKDVLSTAPAIAKAWLARHMPRIVIKPHGAKDYEIISRWELLAGVQGMEGIALLGGAEGQS
jgi:site-specific DNA recombinase